MQKFKNILTIIAIAIVIIPLCILAIPVMLVGIPILHFQRKNFEKKYADFLIENNGKNFFCYNNRRNSKQYLEQSILPNLSEDIDIVYLDGKRIESAYDSKFISEALYGLKHYNKFPHLMKIRNGKLIDTSINNPFYAVLNMNKSKVELLRKINHFFDIVD